MNAPAAPARPVRRASLENGMTVIVRESGEAPVVAMALLVGVGSRHETEETNGVTALLGRVLPKGTKARSAIEVAQAAEDAGGAIESAVDQEYSEVCVRGLARHWRMLLGLLHEVVTSPALALEEIERERETLLAQIRGIEDQPFQVASRLLNRTLYGTHAYGLPTSGDSVSVRRLGRADLVRHFERLYTPDRMVLAVSGQVDGGEVLAESIRLFAGPIREPEAPPLAPPPERPARTRAGETRPTQQTQVLMGFLGPPVGHPDHVAVKVMNTVLGGGMSSRLFRALRDEGGLAYAVGSFVPARRETGRIVVHIGTAPDNATAAEAGMREVVEALRASPASPEEVERAKAYLSGGFALDRRTSTRQSFYLSFFELMGVGHGYLTRYPDLIETVTTADVQRVARRYLVEPSVVVVGPGSPAGGHHRRP